MNLTSAHPRSRGENPTDSKALDTLPGSSPLTRGKRTIVDDLDDVGRLIPAHAGKTASKPASAPPKPAHPRSRGENLPSPVLAAAAAGSSPLTRGKLST